MRPQNRRQFLKNAALGASGAVCGSFVVVEREAAADQPDPKSIIDTHTHFYDPARPEGVPWPGKNDKLLYRRTLPVDYKRIAQPLGVTGTIVVEASPWLEDNQWLLDLAAKDNFLVGVVGHLTPAADNFRKHVDRFAKNPLFRGIRIGSGEVRGGLSQKQFMSDLRYMADTGLELDVNGGPDMLPDVANLGKQIPELRVVINHCANVRIDGKAANPDWLKGLRGAGDYENIFCKVSALVEGASQPDAQSPANVEFYEPVLNALWETFGENRLIYGSNWPVSERFAPYKTVLEIVSKYFKAKGEVPSEKFFWRNSQAAYKWAPR